MTRLTPDEQEEIELLQELRWRLTARQSLVEYARTMPVPGVPLIDNYEKLLEQGRQPRKSEDGKEWYDGRYDGEIVIPQIDTQPAKHHVLIYETTQAVIEGTLVYEGEVCRRAMFMMPPGSAKSTCLDVVGPSWAMGKYGHEVILASCADMLAKRDGKRARQLCGSEEHRAVFETEIDPETRAADNWALTNGGKYLSAGLHGGLMGNRADGLVCDDLLRGRRSAESETERENAWIAYKDDARTRKKPNGWELMIGTRWHEDDVMGRILPKDWAGQSGFFRGRDGYLWYVVCLQAQVELPGDPLGREIGEYLWEEWFHVEHDPEEYWRPLKLDERSWSSLYQQVPTPPKGNVIKREWVRYYDFLPKDLNRFISGDYAVTESEADNNPDFSSLGDWGVDSEGMVYFIDGVHGQWAADAGIEHTIDLIERSKAMAHIAGKGQIRRAVEPFLKIRMRKRKVFTELVWLEESYSKEVNLQSFRSMMASGMVLWPRENEEAEWVIRHLLGFPTLTIDDPVDMCSMLGRHLTKLWGPRKPKEEPPPLVAKPGAIKMAGVIKRRKVARAR